MKPVGVRNPCRFVCLSDEQADTETEVTSISAAKGGFKKDNEGRDWIPLPYQVWDKFTSGWSGREPMNRVSGMISEARLV
jgi:hypothetical protein